MMACGQADALGGFTSLANSLTLTAFRLPTIRFFCPHYSQPVQSALPMWTICARIEDGIAGSGNENRGEVLSLDLSPACQQG